MRSRELTYLPSFRLPRETYNDALHQVQQTLVADLPGPLAELRPLASDHPASPNEPLATGASFYHLINSAVQSRAISVNALKYSTAHKTVKKSISCIVRFF